jgi:hypothetical protein
MNDYLIDDIDGIEIYHKKNLCYSESYSFILKHYANAIDEGKVFSITPWNNDTCGVFYSKINDKIVGALVYDTDYNERNNKGILGITFAAVNVNYRRIGIYSLLHKKLEAWGVAEGFPVLGVLANKNDSVFLDCSKKMGLNLIMHRTIKYLDK